MLLKNRYTIVFFKCSREYQINHSRKNEIANLLQRNFPVVCKNQSVIYSCVFNNIEVISNQPAAKYQKRLHFQGQVEQGEKKIGNLVEILKDQI